MFKKLTATLLAVCLLASILVGCNSTSSSHHSEHHHSDTCSSYCAY